MQLCTANLFWAEQDPEGLSIYGWGVPPLTPNTKEIEMPYKVLDILQIDEIDDEILLVKKLSAFLQLKRSSEKLVVLVCEEVQSEQNTPENT